MEDTVVLTVSVDLPFAQGKWCAAEGIENAIMLSDYFDHSFGKAYGLLINEWHLLARAVLVLDADNKITYVEYLDNINSEPKLRRCNRSRQSTWINEKRGLRPLFYIYKICSEPFLK